MTTKPASRPVPAPPVYVAKSHGKGRGVYAARKIRKAEIIERSPVIVVPEKEWTRHVEKTGLSDYTFDWGRDNDHAAIVLGYGMLYNHSHTPNARFTHDLRAREYIFTALRDIKKDEEIYTNYNGDPEDNTPLWFERGGKTK